MMTRMQQSSYYYIRVLVVAIAYVSIRQHTCQHTSRMQQYDYTYKVVVILLHTCSLTTVYYCIFFLIFSIFIFLLYFVLLLLYTTVYFFLILVYTGPHPTICVLILLHMSSHTTMCPHIYVCPHTTMCVLILYMCPHPTAYVFSYYYMCPHTNIYLRPHTRQTMLGLFTLHRYITRSLLDVSSTYLCKLFFFFLLFFLFFLEISVACTCAPGLYVG